MSALHTTTGPVRAPSLRRGIPVTPGRLSTPPLLLAVLAVGQLQRTGAPAEVFSTGTTSVLLYTAYGALALVWGVVHGFAVQVRREPDGTWRYRATLAVLLPLVALVLARIALEAAVGADGVLLPPVMVLIAGVAESVLAHVIIGLRTIWRRPAGRAAA